MDISKAFPSNYLKADDLEGKAHELQIAECALEWLGQGKDKEQKPVLFFEGAKKGLVLNVTNATVIREAYGKETNDWAGKPVEVYPTQVEFRGKLVDGIRVRVPKEESVHELLAGEPPRPTRTEPTSAAGGAATNPEPAAGGGNAAAELNDSIPFAAVKLLP